ncbi:anti-sigma B factor RsbW [Thermoproteota archaeon]
MAVTHSINLDIPSISDYVAVARLSVSGVASRLDFPIDDIEDIKIAVSEACTNVVQYAYNDPGQGRIYLTYNIHPDKLEIIVTDKGGGFDIKNPASEKRQVELDSPVINLGLGLTFIESLMDEMKVDSKQGSGTTLKMAKYRPKARK